jgi:GNAT superfamily N-acetyltransferase/ABC-type ATPase involved in cell division
MGSRYLCGRVRKKGKNMETTLRVSVSEDEITKEICRAFDYQFNGTTETKISDFHVNNDFSIGLIVGSSGSGKSTLLQKFGNESKFEWDSQKCIASHFKTADEAQSRLAAVGLNSIPAWLRPYHALSTGEKYRADLAMQLKSGAIVDEFTSVIDRPVAMSCANAVNRYAKQYGLKNVVFASCHYDIIDWLQPDWVYDTLTQKLSYRGSARRQQIDLEIFPCGVESWSIFSKHHYLTDDINKSAKHWLCTWGSNVVGFASAIAYPSGTVKNAYRGHRTVVLPDYQGLGIGVRLSDAVAEIHKQQGFRYFSKTAHPRMGEYRNNSPLWKPTSKNMIERNDPVNNNVKWLSRKVFSYSHEYVGGHLVHN